MEVFPYDDERLTLYALAGGIGFAATLRALAEVAELMDGRGELPAGTHGDAVDLAVRLRALALDVAQWANTP